MYKDSEPISCTCKITVINCPAYAFQLPMGLTNISQPVEIHNARSKLLYEVDFHDKQSVVLAKNLIIPCPGKWCQFIFGSNFTKY